MSEKKNAWLKYDEKQKEEIFSLCDGYKAYISDCKTERECVTRAIELAKEQGYVDLADKIAKNESLKPGDKVYYNNMGKALALFIIGEKSIEEGLTILGAHVDSPRVDLKQNPLYEDTEMALFDTHYYGGIKKYQWVTLPMAIHGVVAKKDGSLVNVVIGEDDTDPVLGFTDLLIHLSRTQMEKSGAKVIEGEDLNLLIGSMPTAEDEEDKEKAVKEKVKANILAILKEKYDIEEDDFLSAELEIVPAGKARDYGIDRSMVMGYGQDDRVCSYTSLLAMFEIEKSEKTLACILVDKEEIGSVGATGMHSKFFEDAISEICALTGEYSTLKVRRAFRNSKMLSSDVSAAFDPNYPAVSEKKNVAFFGHGIVFNKYTGSGGKSGSNDANAEYMAELRNIMDSNNIAFQTAELGRVDAGGGGTIAYILAKEGMEVIDSGVPVLNMHAPWEITSKVDIYETFKGYIAFLKNA